MQVDDALVAFTPDRAAQLAGLTRRKVDYWRKTLLLSPSTDEQVSAHRSIRLYDFVDMLALMTVGELLRRDVTLQRIRKIVQRMRELGLDKPLTELRFGTVATGNDTRKDLLVTVTLKDGTVVGDDDLGQSVLAEVVDIEEIRTSIRRATQRNPADVGRTERRRNARGSREVFAGTRVPVETVRAYVIEGLEDAEILEAFPTLQRADLDAIRVPA